MDRRVLVGGGIIAVAVAAVGFRMASDTGAKTGLDDALAHLPPGFTATHGAVTYNALTGEAHVRDLTVSRNGSILLTAGDVAVSGIGDKDASGMPKRIGEIVMHDASAGPYKHIQRIDLTGVSLATLRDVLDPAAYPGGRPAWTGERPAVDHMEAHGIDGEQTSPQPKGPPVEIKFAVGTATLDGLKLGQLPAPPDYAAPPMVLVAEVEQNMAQDGNSLKDVTFAVSGPGLVTGRVGRGAARHYDNGKLDAMTLDDFSITTAKPAGTITLGGMSAHGVDFSKMLAVLPAVIAAPNVPHPEVLNGMHLSNAEMHGLRIDYPDGPLVLLESVSGGSRDAGSSVFAMHALTVQTTGRPLAPATRAQLASFGMADFTTDLNEVGGYDAATQQAVLKRCDIDFHQLGTLHLTFTINGVAPVSMSSPQEIQAAVAQARLAGASATWDDASLTERLLRMAAAKQGVTPEQLRAGLAIPLASLGVLMPEQPDAGAQVDAFLDGRHRLAVTLAPPAPVSLAQWAATPPAGKAELLGVHISGN